MQPSARRKRIASRIPRQDAAHRAERQSSVATGRQIRNAVGKAMASASAHSAPSLAGICIARKRNAVDRLPIRAPKRDKRVETYTVAVLTSHTRETTRKTLPSTAGVGNPNAIEALAPAG